MNMNFKQLAVLVALGVIFQSANADERDDYRMHKILPAGHVFPFTLRDEVDVLQTIKRSNDEKLIQAIERGGLPLRLRWNKRIPLADADYVLCLFDSIDRIYPGNNTNPRVLVLFDLKYKIKTYGLFTHEDAFDYGAIVQRQKPPNTYFVTVNPSWRFGGCLFFEKYLITPDAITKLGEGAELTQIPD